MRRLTAIALLLPALAMTACGGDGESQTAAPGTPENPLRALPNPQPTRVPPTDETGGAAKSKAAAERVSRPQSVIVAQKRTQARNERARKAKARAKAKATAASRGPRKQLTPGPSAERPCSLVTKAQARAIIGQPLVEPLEAPQGPTCIYQSTAGRQLITLTVQTTDFQRLRSQIRAPRTVSIAQRTAVCGSYGRAMLYLPLSGGRVLTVSGPCTTASRIAAKAVAHL